MHDFFHAPQTAGVRNPFGVRLEIFAELCRDRNRTPEQIIPAPAAVNIDALENIVERLLLEPGNGQQLIRLAQRFQFFDRLNAEAVVNFLRGLRTDARNLDHLRETERNFLLQVLVKLDFSGSDVFVDLICEIFTDARNAAQASIQSERLDVIGEAFDVRRCTAVGSNAKRIGALDFEEIGYLVEEE